MVLLETDALAGKDLARPFPPEVEFIISALEAGPRPVSDRRRSPRHRYRVHAQLRLFSDAEASAPWRLYTRHVSVKGLDFLVDRFLPLSHGGIVTLPSPTGKVLHVHCTILRCREAAPGWYEGAVYFNREQVLFSPEHFKRSRPVVEHR